MDDLKFLNNTLRATNPTNEQTRGLKLIVIEDDKNFSFAIKKYLSKHYQEPILVFNNPGDYLLFLDQASEKDHFLLLLDISLGAETDGLTLLEKTNAKKLNNRAIVMTGFGSIETAINATKKGAFHYLTKPFTLENLKIIVDEAISSFDKSSNVQTNKLERNSYSSSSLVGEKEDKGKLTNERSVFCSMIGSSHKMQEVYKRIEKVSKSESTVLITGESGTGKELVAKAIHQCSNRCEQSLVSVNCGAIPSELLESELFGHVKGSFTGAISNRKGRFELAHYGSIFLDEIGDMPFLLQVKLLRVLQTREIEPVGSDQTKEINVRVIAATHRNIEKQIEQNKFREDLYYRLNVIPIYVPALRERKEDIPLLIEYFINKYSSADKSNAIFFSDSALEYMISYDWPGNVRELENVIERLVILRGGNKVLIEDLPIKIINQSQLKLQSNHLVELPNEGLDIKNFLSGLERSLILQALERTNGNRNQASKLLSLNRTTLIEKLKKLDTTGLRL
ncbi:sigma-54 dependent transcriptional regulator [Bacteriovoracaceae bacterium]|nr:sigma-54 dependent transcriptional regulator [Bacteriovoracaceae bacterium]